VRCRQLSIDCEKVKARRLQRWLWWGEPVLRSALVRKIRFDESRGLAFKPRTKKLIGEIGLIHEVARTTQCERLILTGLRGQSASLFDKFPSRRPHNIKKLWFSKALLRMMINPRGEHAPQYLGLFQVLTFAFRNQPTKLDFQELGWNPRAKRLRSVVDRQRSICGDSHFRLSRPQPYFRGANAVGGFCRFDQDKAWQ